MRVSHAIVAFLLASLLAGASTFAAPLPRYRLDVGRKLVYSMTSQSQPTDGQGPNRGSEATQELIVLHNNPDGSKRVVVRSASKMTSGGAQGNEPEDVEIAYADVFDDGRVLPNPSLGMRVSLDGVLPSLPKDEAELSKGWSRDEPEKMLTIHYSPQKQTTDGAVSFVAVQDGMLNKIYVTTSKTTFHFDDKKGAIVSAESEHSQDYGFHIKGEGTTKLLKDETVPPDQLAPLASDYDALFAAQEQCHDEMRKAEGDPDRTSEAIAAARSIIEKASASTKTDAVKAELTKMLADQDRYAKYAQEDAERMKEVLNKPAPDWDATDIDGKPVKMSDFRGKVVVMDFWYRGCGWCMYAMPQVKQISEDFAGKPVAVLGMNTDSEEKDARFVIDAMGLKYRTIKATGVPEKFGVHGFPTLIVVDQQGIVRGFHVGYSPTLRQDIGRKIQELLDKPSKSPA